MTPESITFTTENPNPSLQETAEKMGIDTANIATDVNGAVQADPVKSVVDGKARPDNIPEKFWNAEKGEVNTDALLKSYTELEKKSGAPKPVAEGEAGAKEAEKAEADAEESLDDAANAAAKEAADKAGINLEEVSSRYWETGKISDDDYAALEKAGYPKNLVDQFAAGQQAVIEAERQSVFKLTGGEDNYKSMIEWARTGLDANEIAAYDNAVNGGDKGQMLMAVNGLKARYEADKGTEPVNLMGKGRSASADIYESKEQMKADMANPLYRKDPAFRAKVEAKVGRSPF